MITVALPVYKRKSIAWLALEGLARQETSQDWELIVCEEVHDGQCGSGYFFEYMDRLALAGCKQITYIELKDWINLPNKWLLMSRQAEGDDFILQASDSWSDPGRLERNYNSLRSNGWTNDIKTHFYQVGTGKMVLFDLNMRPTKRNAVGIGCGMKTEYLRKMKPTGYTRGVDGVLYEFVERAGNKKFNREYELFKSLEIQGVNNISAHREIFYSRITPPYKPAVYKAEDILPYDIIERLKLVKPENTLFMKNKLMLKRDWQGSKKGDEISVTGPVGAYLVKKNIAGYIEPEPTVTVIRASESQEKQTGNQVVDKIVNNESDPTEKSPSRTGRRKGGGRSTTGKRSRKAATRKTAG